MADIKNRYVLDVSSYEKGTAKIKKSNNDIEKSNKKVKKSNSDVSKSTDDIKKSNDNLKKSNDDIKKSNDTVSTSSTGVTKGLKAVEGQEGVYRNSMGRLVDANGRFIKTNGDVAKSLKGLSGEFVIGAGVVGAAAVKKSIDYTKEAINVYSDFQREMNMVRAVTGSSAEDQKMLSKQAQDLGKTTSFSAVQVAEAMKFLGLAGFELNEIMETTPKLLKAAAASGEDLGRVSDIVSDQMTAFGIQAKNGSRLIDTLSMAATSSNTTIGQLGEALEQGGGTAATLGASIEETTALLSLMANRSIKGGKAGTSLKNMFLRLTAPTDKAKESLDKYGIEIFDAQGNMLKMENILGQLEKSMGNMNDEQKSMFLTSVFGRESLAGINAVLESGTEELKKYTKMMKESEGATERMADITMEGLVGDLEEIKSMMEGIKISSMEVNEHKFSNIIKEIKGLEKEMQIASDMAVKLASGIAMFAVDLIKAPIQLGKDLAMLQRQIKTGKSYSQLIAEDKYNQELEDRKERGEEIIKGVGEGRMPTINDLMEDPLKDMFNENLGIDIPDPYKNFNFTPPEEKEEDPRTKFLSGQLSNELQPNSNYIKKDNNENIGDIRPTSFLNNNDNVGTVNTHNINVNIKQQGVPINRDFQKEIADEIAKQTPQLLGVNSRQ